MTLKELEEKEKKLSGPSGEFAFTAIVTSSTVDTINALNKNHRIIGITAEQAADGIMAFRVILGNPFGDAD